ncbi:uncharacterized protein LOC117344597 isoform X2 [Pecten maximus]|uniref:uncharacterized protein LOC117344597 isoform X2 n=1 Tax=Pecten maximus TaxID=6579 RepID=UPI001458A4FD|nr:uncharacterized protein LOC117344597 isoform X2 [Pecten maximus]
MNLVISKLSCLLLLTFPYGVQCLQCDFTEETVPEKQPDGSFRCVCDRSKGYIGQFDYACAFVPCPANMEPDDKAFCQCINEFFFRDSQCVHKSRCKPDETIVHNGSRFDDRRCLKMNTQVSIRDPPLTMIEDIKPTSIRIQVFRNENETGQLNVTLTVSAVTDGDTQRVITDSIGETRMSVSVNISELEANSSYRVQVTSSNEAGTSDPTLILLHTQDLIPARAPEVKLRDVNQTACTLEIIPDKKIDRSGKIFLEFRSLTDDTKGYMMKEIERGKITTVMYVDGLVANTTYQFQIKTDDIAGLSDARQIIIQTTAEVVKNTQHEGGTSIESIVIPVLAVVAFVCIISGIIWRRTRRGTGNDRNRIVNPVEETDVRVTERTTINIVDEALEAAEDATNATTLLKKDRGPIIRQPVDN